MRHTVKLSAGLVALLGVSLPLVADIKPNEKAVSEAARASREKPADTSKLRCWQYGELLFEESGISNKTLASQSRAITFERGPENKGKLLLVDFGTATCVYEQ